MHLLACALYTCVRGLILCVEMQLFLSPAWKVWVYFSHRARGSAEAEWGGRWRIGLSCASAGCDECRARLHLLSARLNTVFHFHHWIKVSVCAAEWLLYPSGKQTGPPSWWKPCCCCCSVVLLLLRFLLMENQLISLPQDYFCRCWRRWSNFFLEERDRSW